MRTLPLMIAVTFTALNSFAQDTVYVYQNFDKVAPEVSRSRAAYFTLVPDASEEFQGLITFYDLEGKLAATVAFDETGKKHGLTTHYFPEGDQEKEQLYQKNQENGKFKKWYRNGQQEEEGLAVPVPVTTEKGFTYYLTDYLLHQYWDSLGTQVVHDGKGELIRYHSTGAIREKGAYAGGRKTGIWEGAYQDGSPYFIEEYQDGKLLSGISYCKGAEFSYTHLDEEAEPLEGLASFYAFLADEVKYPKAAIRHFVEGTTYTRFVINEQGIVAHAEPVEGRELGWGLDEESMRVILLTKWKPGKHRGQLAKQRKILPMKYRLDGGKKRKQKS